MDDVLVDDGQIIKYFDHNWYLYQKKNHFVYAFSLKSIFIYFP